jgi:4-alpha-glucanotransferase
MTKRGSGILLHLTSLPGPHGHGDLGPHARAFAEWLASAGQKTWQTLPVVPPGFAGSPYDGRSAFAGSPWLVSLEDLARDGLLEPEELAASFSPERADHEAAMAFREARLRLAATRFLRRSGAEEELARFRRKSSGWLLDWARYSALRRAHGDRDWSAWPSEIRRREPTALETADRELAHEIELHEVIQLWFQRQWAELRAHCRAHGVSLLGDVPMFVAYDSSDVWQNPEAFLLDENGFPRSVAGVPPDAFSESGQLWGNPLYDWERMRASGFEWWLQRLEASLERFDRVRLDHFIGFHRYWEIPRTAKDAREGRFVNVPGAELFEAARKRLGGLPFVAEDLGVVTDEVKALRDCFELPGMRVLQFAYDDDEPNDYRPERYVANTVVYTGTHDNDTTRGWLDHAAPRTRERVLSAVGGEGTEALHLAVMRLAAGSVADSCIFPLQDALGQGSEARMNTPGTTLGNWCYRVRAEELTPSIAGWLRALALGTGRLPA